MRISTRCYAVTGLAYMPPWSVNAGFIVGDTTTLIVDTGANASSAALIHGYASAVRPSNALMVIDTEKHFDHIGGNGWFRQSGIDVWGHAGIMRTQEEFESEIAEFNAIIPNQARRERREAEAFYQGTTLANPNHRIDRDTEIDLGGVVVKVLLTPGHTPTNLSVWIPEDRVLYCGDCLANLYIPNLDAGGPDAWPQWLGSLDRIAALGAKGIVCGHGPVVLGDAIPPLIDSVRSVIERSIEIGRSPTADVVG